MYCLCIDRCNIKLNVFLELRATHQNKRMKITSQMFTRSALLNICAMRDLPVLSLLRVLDVENLTPENYSRQILAKHLLPKFKN